jgi:Serine dehydrogenase proteinase
MPSPASRVSVPGQTLQHRDAFVRENQCMAKIPAAAIKGTRLAIESFAADSVDVYAYSGPIDRAGYSKLCAVLAKRKEKSTRALLFLVTGGGDPNAGYRIARAMGHHYGAENFRVAIPAECKSAGTLICIGANSLVLFDRGELGPLDVQFQKQDEIFQQSSGLDILRGMTYLRREALETFSEYLLDINSASGLSTGTASEIASKLVIGLFEPIFAQIDPIRLGEMNAALAIANEYGERLSVKARNLKGGALDKLIHTYPTHGFVIDRAEARNLFERVEAPTPTEQMAGVLVLRLCRPTSAAANEVIDLIELLQAELPQKEGTYDQDESGDSVGSSSPSEQGGAPPRVAEGGKEVDGVGQPLVEGQQGDVRTSEDQENGAGAGAGGVIGPPV